MTLLTLALLSLSLGSYQIKDLIRTYTIGDSTEVIEQATLQVKLIKSEPDEAFIYGLNAALMDKIGLIKAFYGKDTSGSLLSVDFFNEGYNKTGIRVHLIDGRSDDWTGKIPEDFHLHLYIIYPIGGEILNVVSTPTLSEEVLSTLRDKNDVSQTNHLAMLKFTTCIELPSFYPCSKQKTTFEFSSKKTKFSSLDTDFRGYQVLNTETTTKIAIDQISYGPEYTCTLIDLTYYSNAYQFAVNAVRTVIVNGPTIKTRTNMRGFVTIVDDFVVRNVNPRSSDKHFSNKNILMRQHYDMTIPAFFMIELPCEVELDDISYHDRIGKIDTIEVDTESMSKLRQKFGGQANTVLRVRPRFAVAGDSQTKFTLKYTCNNLVSLSKNNMKTLPKESERHTYGLVLPSGPTILHAYYDSFSLCVYPPSGATDVQVHVPFAGIISNKTYSGTLDINPRNGGCVSAGLSTNEGISAPFTTIWSYDTKEMLLKKLRPLSINFFIIMCTLSFLRTIVGK
ncbi:Hypothetical protein GLP15_2491 [Giardia lamblia P15]|uniref:Dolichyl-diphosphooligosaccharide--protein glycosyltransferase subunit 1 n=1 Tax=Giardia intestinalis (strain P15) TaxID=658858 RepID=E1EWH5_GIAIA|nr:Hypothetical protein GLP15_2491 [Giardia lamblia P15]